jgi:hypothetical protein
MADKIERCHNCQEPARRQRLTIIPDHIHEEASRIRIVGGKCKTCGEAVGASSASRLEHSVLKHFRHVSWERIRYEDHNGPCGLPCEETLTGGEKRLRGAGRYHDGSTCPCMHPAAIEARRKRDEAAEAKRRGGGT